MILRVWMASCDSLACAYAVAVLGVRSVVVFFIFGVSMIRWLRDLAVFFLVLFVVAWVRPVGAGTVAASGLYCQGSGAYMGCGTTAAEAGQAYALANAADYASGYPPPMYGSYFEYRSATATTFAIGYNSCQVGVGTGCPAARPGITQTFTPSVTSGTCPTGYVLRSSPAVCSNVNDTAGTGGGCHADVVQQMQVAPNASGNAPYEVSYGGCVFRLGQARLMRLVDTGGLVMAGTWYSTGATGTGGGVGSASSTVAAIGAGANCPNSRIVNIATGVASCVAAVEGGPAAVVSTGGVDSSGNAVETSQVCVGDQCLQQVATTVSGVTTTVSGPSSLGGLAAAPTLSFPSDLAKDATVSGLGAKLDSANSSLSSVVGSLSDLGFSAVVPGGVSDVSAVQATTLEGSFSSLRSWALPSRSVSCPTWALDLTSFHSGWSWTFDSQCTVWASGTVSASVQAIALLLWAVAAMLIVLSA